jgi:hypothetical protein
VRCTHCPRHFLALQLEEHEAECPDALVPCPNERCGEVVARSSLKGHRKRCRREIVRCPCPGCESKFARGQRPKHLEDAKEQHLRKAWAKAKALEAKVSEQGRAKEELKRSLEAKLSAQQDAMQAAERSLKAMSVELIGLQKSRLHKRALDDLAIRIWKVATRIQEEEEEEAWQP